MSKELTLLEYYKLKHKYNKSVKKIVDRTLKDTGNKRHKSLKFDALIKNVPCPQCGTNGQVRFESTATQLIIRCSNKKCKISNITIPRPRVLNIFDKLENVAETCNIYKEAVVKIKLDLFFKYIDENKAISEFSSIKVQLSEANEELIELTEKMDLITNKNDALMQLKEEYEIISDEMSGLIKEEKGNIAILMEFHIEKLMPIVKQMREMKYKYNFLEDDRGKEVKNNNLKTPLYLTQKIYSLQDLEIKID